VATLLSVATKTKKGCETTLFATKTLLLRKNMVEIGVKVSSVVVLIGAYTHYYILV